jgi:hypothetical protein
VQRLIKRVCQKKYKTSTMKNISRLITLLLILTVVFFSSCVKDTCTHKFTTYAYKPVYKQMRELRDVTVQAAKPITVNGKMFVKDNFVYLNEVNKGFHVIDNSNPAAPKAIAFVSVPGCIDIAAKGNYLLADNYLDLLTFDITKPSSIKLMSRKENALPHRIYNYGFTDDSVKGVIVSFEKTDINEKTDCAETRNWWVRNDVFFTISQSTGLSAVPVKSTGGNGQAGSLSRFAVLNDYLYIANRFTITTVNIINPLQPEVKRIVSAFGEAETIYPFNDVLLIGGPTGMRIFSVANPEQPTYTGGVSHWRGCDPVVAENNKAYVTIRGGSPCGGNFNQLDVIDITDIRNPKLEKSYPMQNPYGLSIYNGILGICDGDAGFKLFDASQSINVKQLSVTNTTKAFDVILNDKTAMLIAQDGLYQYNIDNRLSPVLISKIPITAK